MMNIKFLPGILIFSLFFTSASYAFDFTGIYKCAGYDPYLNKPYTGTLVIEQQNAVYKISMVYNTGERYRATGGPYDENLLSVVFQDTKNPEVIGLEQYRLSNDKKQMGGFWVYLGKDKLGKEVCIKQ
jgi:hypothetical protein